MGHTKRAESKAVLTGWYSYEATNRGFPPQSSDEERQIEGGSGGGGSPQRCSVALLGEGGPHASPRPTERPRSFSPDESSPPTAEQQREREESYLSAPPSRYTAS